MGLTYATYGHHAGSDQRQSVTERLIREPLTTELLSSLLGHRTDRPRSRAEVCGDGLPRRNLCPRCEKPSPVRIQRSSGSLGGLPHNPSQTALQFSIQPHLTPSGCLSYTSSMRCSLCVASAHPIVSSKTAPSVRQVFLQRHAHEVYGSRRRAPS